MSLGAIFARRVRGVRLVEVWAIGVLAVLVCGVYLSKTFAGREAADITRAQTQISEEQTRIRLLKAEVAYLEQPERIERLSQAYLRLEPMSGKREAEPETLAEIARRPSPPLPPDPVSALPVETAVPAADAAPMAMAAVSVPAPAAGAPR